MAVFKPILAQCHISMPPECDIELKWVKQDWNQ